MGRDETGLRAVYKQVLAAAFPSQLHLPNHVLRTGHLVIDWLLVSGTLSSSSVADKGTALAEWGETPEKSPKWCCLSPWPAH